MARTARVLACCDADTARCLQQCTGIEVVARVRGRDALVERARAVRPDLAILTIATAGPADLAAIGHVRAAVPGCGILVLVAEHDERQVVPVVSAGATGYLRRENVRQELARAVRALCSGEVYYDPDVVRILVTKLAQGQDCRPVTPGAR